MIVRAIPPISSSFGFQTYPNTFLTLKKKFNSLLLKRCTEVSQRTLMRKALAQFKTGYRPLRDERYVCKLLLAEIEPSSCRTELFFVNHETEFLMRIVTFDTILPPSFVR